MNDISEIKYAWHVHHNVLLEPLTEPLSERIFYIKTTKLKEDVPLRLRLLKVVEGKLPEVLLETYMAYEAAGRAFFEATKAVRTEAWTAYIKSEEAYEQALEDCAAEINALHTKECPDCPWDGRTIFK